MFRKPYYRPVVVSKVYYSTLNQKRFPCRSVGQNSPNGVGVQGSDASAHDFCHHGSQLERHTEERQYHRAIEQKCHANMQGCIFNFCV